MPLDPTFFLQKIFTPIRKILVPLLKSVAGNAVTDSAVREQLITLADHALISEYPQARLIPSSLRRKLIGQVLDSILGEAGATGVAEPASSDGETAASEVAAQFPESDSDQIAFGAPGDSVRGFMVDAKSPDIGPVRDAIVQVLGSAPEVEPVGGTTASFYVTAASKALSTSEAWELAHRLEDHPQITAAEPVFEWVPAPPEILGADENFAASMSAARGESQTLDCAATPTWSADAINAVKAWKVSTDAGCPEQGKGIKVAHLDTGVTYHDDLPPLSSPSVIINKGANFYDPSNTGGLPIDPMNAGALAILRTWFIPLNGHGTGTLSVLLCPTGKQMIGVAPQAVAIPVRIGPTVVHWNLKRIIDGIRYAHQQGCNVITMSMGGPPPVTRALSDVVDAAVKDGVIFCSAAGNVIGNQDWFPIVVWPAALDNVIAIGGGNCKGQAWDGSSRGPEVNISAEAQDVWHAAAITGSAPAGPHGTSISPGNGTSFATPAAAGLAACWLAHHGIQTLINEYGDASYIPLAFAYPSSPQGIQKGDTNTFWERFARCVSR